MIHSLRFFGKAARDYLLFGATRSADHVNFSDVGKLYINPADNRGIALLKNRGVSQPKITLLWRLLTKRLDPTLVLDIGANHGEVSLSISYKKETLILMFEPNPALTPFLQKSIAAHVNRKQISLSKALVSDLSSEQEFFVDLKWSGTSSAVGPIHDESNAFKGESNEKFERLVLPSVSIDDALKDMAIVNQRLLFKIDVEGFESKVIIGMTRTLSSVKSFAGIMEFDKELLQRAGTNPRTYFSSLQELGGVWILNRVPLSGYGTLKMCLATQTFL